MRERVRHLHYSLQTEKAYVYWAKAFVLWAARSQGWFRHPRELGQTEVEGFLTMLATEKQVTPATHRQALYLRTFRASAQDLWARMLGSRPSPTTVCGRLPKSSFVTVGQLSG